MALICLPKSSSQSGGQHENLLRRGGAQQRKRIPFTLVMPYRKQRETNARKVNKIKILKKEGGGGGSGKEKRKKEKETK